MRVHAYATRHARLLVTSANVDCLRSVAVRMYTTPLLPPAPPCLYSMFTDGGTGTKAKAGRKAELVASVLPVGVLVVFFFLPSVSRKIFSSWCPNSSAPNHPTPMMTSALRSACITPIPSFLSMGHRMWTREALSHYPWLALSIPSYRGWRFEPTRFPRCVHVDQAMLLLKRRTTVGPLPRGACVCRTCVQECAHGRPWHTQLWGLFSMPLG